MEGFDLLSKESAALQNKQSSSSMEGDAWIISFQVRTNSIHRYIRYLKARSLGRAARTLLFRLLTCKTASRCSSRQMHLENLRKITVRESSKGVRKRKAEKVNSFPYVNRQIFSFFSCHLYLRYVVIVPKVDV